MDQGDLGKYGQLHPGERELAWAGVQWRPQTPSLLPEMVSDFDSPQDKPVTLMRASQGPRAVANLKTASRAWHPEDVLDSCPPWLVRTSWERLRPLLAGSMSAFLRKGKLPTTMKYAIVHLLLKLKKIFFPSIAKNSLATVQWSNSCILRERD